MFKTPHLHCRGRGFYLWEGMKIPHAAGHRQKKRDNNKVGCVSFQIDSGARLFMLWHILVYK